MADNMAVGMGSGWSAVGGRVLTPAGAARPLRNDDQARVPARPLRGHVSLATSDGLLGPGRRLRYRRSNWLRYAAVWASLVFLMPLAAGWAWGLVG